MIARNEKDSHLESELESTKGFICDVRNVESIENTVNEVVDYFGHPDTFTNIML